MNTFFRQFFIFLKRTLCKPIYCILLLLIPAIAIGVKALPQKAVSTNIKTGIYTYDQDEYTSQIVKQLTANETGFIFVACTSEQELMELVASGELDCGYVLPADFSEAFVADINNSHMNVYTSPATLFVTISNEIVFHQLLQVYAVPIVTNYFSSVSEFQDALPIDYATYIPDIYEDYMTNNSVFTIVTNSTGDYQNDTEQISMFPLYKFVGLLIFIAALFGLMNALKDEDQNIYLRLNKRNRLKFYILNIISNLLPAACIGYLTLLIYGTDKSPAALALHMLVYIIICLLFTLLYRIIFRTYRFYIAALPILLACTLVLSPIFIDLTGFLPVLKFISKLFAPTYF